MTRPGAIMVLLALAAVTIPASASATTERFALVVGNNNSLDRSLPKLRYADDDAARFFELLTALGARGILLSVFGKETQKVFPKLTHAARAPTRAGLRAAMRELVTKIKAARKRGARTVLYFYFAGHGDVGQDREGYLHLLDGRFGRSDLYREVIARSPAHVNHVLIDACNSYFLINQRGARQGRSSYRQALRSFLASESLERFPNTGVVLSTASSGETHEWSRYGSGIFSYQLLSALWGTADVNDDASVDYGELAAYIAAANLRVRDRRARLSVFVRAPRSNSSAKLVDLKQVKRVSTTRGRPIFGRVAGVLSLPKSLGGHYHLVDDRGVRYADFHKSTEHQLRIALLDRPYYYLRSSNREALLKLDRPGPVSGESLTFVPLPLSARGSIERSFRRDLYAVPFGRAFAEGHAAGSDSHQQIDVDDESEISVAAPRRLGVLKWIAAGAATAALATGVTMQVLTASAQADLEEGEGEISMRRAADLQQQVNTRQAVAGAAFGIAGGLAVASLVLFLLDRDGPSRSRVQVASDGRSLLLSGLF